MSEANEAQQQVDDVNQDIQNQDLGDQLPEDLNPQVDDMADDVDDVQQDFEENKDGGEGGENGEGGEAAQTSEQDQRSVYVKNVDYSSTKEEISEFFKSCGKINRVTIVTDKYTGSPKGFAYIEFAEKEGAENATLYNDTTFKGRTIQVMPKRTNVPHRGRGGRGRRSGRGFFNTMRRGYQMFGMRSMRRGFRPF